MTKEPAIITTITMRSQVNGGGKIIANLNPPVCITSSSDNNKIPNSNERDRVGELTLKLTNELRLIDDNDADKTTTDKGPAARLIKFASPQTNNSDGRPISREEASFQSAGRRREKLASGRRVAESGAGDLCRLGSGGGTNRSSRMQLIAEQHQTKQTTDTSEQQQQPTSGERLVDHKMDPQDALLTASTTGYYQQQPPHQQAADGHLLLDHHSDSHINQQYGGHQAPKSMGSYEHYAPSSYSPLDNMMMMDYHSASANSYSYCATSGEIGAGDHHFNSHHSMVAGNSQHLELLELEAVGEVALMQKLAANYQQQPSSQQVNRHNFNHLDHHSFAATSGAAQAPNQYETTTSSVSYLNLDQSHSSPSPHWASSASASVAYVCDLPDSVIRLNNQQQEADCSAISGQSTSGAQQQQQQHDNNSDHHLQLVGQLHNNKFTGSSHSLSGYSGIDNEQQQHPANNHHQLHLSTASSCYSSGASNFRSQQQTGYPPAPQRSFSVQQAGADSGGLVPTQHQLEGQSKPEPELKVCEWEGCEHTFLDMNAFVKHLEDRHVNQEPREKNRYFCLWSNCKRNEQEFNARYKLLIHMRVHSGEKPYPCNNRNCLKSFSRLENLKIHQRSHTGEKPYKCNFDGCIKSFTNSSDRIKHHKTHKDPKPYFCNYNGCSKRYTDPSSLRKHLRAHKRSASGCQQVSGSNSSHEFGRLRNQLQFQQTEQTGGCIVLATQSPVGPQSHAPAHTNSNPVISSRSSSSSEHSSSMMQLPPAVVIDSHWPPAQSQQQQQTGGCSSEFDPATLLFSGSSIQTGSHSQQQQSGSGSCYTTTAPSGGQLFVQTHDQLSRSWCAGSGRRASRPLVDASACCFEAPDAGNHPLMQQPSLSMVQPQQPQYGSARQLPLPEQHEAMMRSLPLGGFRVPFSQQQPSPRPLSEHSSGAHSQWSSFSQQPGEQQFVELPRGGDSNPRPHPPQPPEVGCFQQQQQFSSN